MNRLTRAFVCAPLVPGVLMSLVMFNPATLLFAVPLSYLAMAIFGVPLYWLTQRFWGISLATCACGGGVAGIAVCLVIGSASLSLDATASLALATTLFAILGALTGASFWLFGGGVRTRSADRAA